MRFFTSLLLPLLPLLPLTTALGINCRGSPACDVEVAFDSSISRVLVQHINGIDDDRWYNNGQQIACTPFPFGGHVCAFLQNTDGAPGRNIKGLAHFIVEHFCQVCGSVPYFYPYDNNVDNGELTFNIVGDAACDQGAC